MPYFSGDFFSRIHRDRMTINNQYFNYMKRRYTFSLLLSGALLFRVHTPDLILITLNGEKSLNNRTSLGQRM